MKREIRRVVSARYCMAEGGSLRHPKTQQAVPVQDAVISEPVKRTVLSIFKLLRENSISEGCGSSGATQDSSRGRALQLVRSVSGGVIPCELPGDMETPVRVEVSAGV